MAGERKFVTENIRRVLLKEYFMREVKKAGFGGIDIQRTPMGTRVTLMTERPGLVIGRRGSTIKALTEAVEFQFKFTKPQIEVVEVKNPNLNAQIMAEKLAAALERGWHFRRAGHSTVRRIMGSKARGCQIIISGKLTGQRHRMEKFKEGHIKFCGDPKIKWMREGFSIAKLKAGVIGVKVQIMDPDARLPDEVRVLKPDEIVSSEPKPEPPVEASTEAEEPVKEAEQPSEDKKPEKKTKKDKKAEKKDKKDKAKADKKAEKAEKEPKPEPPTETPAETEEPKPAEEPAKEKELAKPTEAKEDKVEKAEEPTKKVPAKKEAEPKPEEAEASIDAEAADKPKEEK